jgi:ribosomal protein L29
MQALAARGRVASSAAAPARPMASRLPALAPPVCAKPSRIADFASLSNEQALQKVADLKAEYLRLQYFQRSRGATLNPDQKDAQPDADKVPKGHEYKAVRRQIAQLLTLVRQRQQADGIDRRTALKLQKAAAVDAGFARVL